MLNISYRCSLERSKQEEASWSQHLSSFPAFPQIDFFSCGSRREFWKHCKKEVEGDFYTKSKEISFHDFFSRNFGDSFSASFFYRFGENRSLL